jgi:hypothetical protein
MLDEVAMLLQQNGIANVYKASMPDEPHGAVCLYQYAGSPPGLVHEGTAWTNPGLQVVSRDTTYPEAYSKIERVLEVLHGRTNTLIGEHKYLRITALQSPFPLGRDSQARHQIAVNFAVARQEN